VKTRLPNTTAGWEQFVLRLSGGGLMLATGAIHLDLYLTGYRSIPTIGVLFALQWAAAFVLGAMVLLARSRLVFAAGAGLAISTLGGYLLTLWIGLFGFREVRTVAGIVAGAVELAAFAVLAGLALSPGTGRVSRRSEVSAASILTKLRAGFPGIGRVVGGFSLVVAVSVAVPVAFTRSSHMRASAALLKVKTIGATAVLTNGQGFTLYWFAPDTSTRSVCNGTCAVYWPPVAGEPTRGAGVTGRIGAIRRADGTTQATYDGHPLYTYVGDGAPGEANGNNIDLNGGVWHEVIASR